ncbi:MAG: hypothetical protein LBQ64_05780 [Bacteroidales bacterium]|jgi:hypothetical protein|nr:hypothetical protein [Bacteroidales bacterium]
MTAKQNRKRYRLHYILRKKGYHVETKDRTVYSYVEATRHRYVLALRDEFDYSVQLINKLTE